LKRKNGIATIIMNRPQVLNALDKETLEELTKTVEELENDSAIHVVILTGKEKAFIAGGDIKQMQHMNTLQAKEFATLGHRLLQNIENSRLPYIAAVNGYALGGGCEVMMACDIIIASDKARFGQPEINLGIIPGGGGTQRLPRLVGVCRAKELILTGDIIKAEEAEKIGLVNRVVPAENLMATAKEIAKKRDSILSR
jgi:enoyl-CoA hydratase